jgi:hypothetical protein
MATMLVGAALALRPEPARTPAPAAKPGIRPA